MHFHLVTLYRALRISPVDALEYKKNVFRPFLLIYFNITDTQTFLPRILSVCPMCGTSLMSPFLRLITHKEENSEQLIFM